MGFFDRLFSRKPAAAASNPVSDDESLPPASAPPVQGPPEFVRAVELQRAYWTHNADEQEQLESRGFDQLTWHERLRLHHLICLQRLNLNPERSAAAEKCRQTVRRLVASDSPYRPRPAMIWQGQSAPTSNQEPDMQGVFLNPSLTHLGCLEVYRVDDVNRPTDLDFVSFDELSDAIFATPNLIRAAKLFYDDGRSEIVLVPLLYGLTWAIGNEYDRAGQMTRFVAHLGDEELGNLGATGIGVGQQDFSVRSPDGSGSLFGLGSVSHISFPLDMRDPRFDEKARARGIDPAEVRRQVNGESLS